MSSTSDKLPPRKTIVPPRKTIVPSPQPAPGDAASITPEQERLLELMRSDNHSAPEPFVASDYWVKINRRFAAEFAAAGINDIGTQSYNRLFSTPGSVKFQRYAMWMLYTGVRARDTHGVLDRMSSVAQPGAAIDFGDHRVTWDTLISLDTLCSLAELDPSIWTDPVVVADLGSGWGRVGHVLTTANPHATYVALDLPESLLIASAVLPPLLPQVPLHPYEECRAITRFERTQLVDRPGVYLCGSHHLERFAPGAVDFFVNVASFQEMTTEQVRLYLGHVDRVAAFAYLQQRWSRPPSLPDAIVAGADAYDFPERWQRRFLRHASFSDLFFETGFAIPAP
jgi:putative sugar O-methyltransferase